MRFPIPRINDNETIRRIMRDAVAATGFSYEVPEKPRLIRKRARRKVTNFHVRIRRSSRVLRQEGVPYGEWEFDLDIKFQTKLEAAYFAHRVMNKVNRRKWVNSCYCHLGLDNMKNILNFGEEYPFLGLQVFNREGSHGRGVIIDSYQNIPDFKRELSRGPWFWRRPDRKIGEIDCVPKQMLIGWDPETGKPFLREWRSLLDFVAGGRIEHIENPLTLDFRLAALQENSWEDEDEVSEIRLGDRPISGPGELVEPERRVEPLGGPERLPETPNPEAERRRNRIRLREKYRQQLDREREEE